MNDANLFKKLILSHIGVGNGFTMFYNVKNSQTIYVFISLVKRVILTWIFVLF